MKPTIIMAVRVFVELDRQRKVTLFVGPDEKIWVIKKRLTELEGIPPNQIMIKMKPTPGELEVMHSIGEL